MPTIVIFCASTTLTITLPQLSDAVHEEVQKRNTNQNMLIFKNGLNNAKHVGYLKCFQG
jgi:hypothetical protein